MSARKPVPATANIVAADTTDGNPQTAAPAAPATDVPVADAASAPSDALNPPADPAAPADPVSQAPDNASAGEDDLVKVRVLSAFDGYEPNDVALLTYAEVRALDHSVDADPAAVAYAKSQDA